jgi:hypothetical protein
VKRSEQLREKALALYAEAKAIKKSGWNAETMRRYHAKRDEAHAVDMAYNDARDQELRQERANGEGN